VKYALVLLSSLAVVLALQGLGRADAPAAVRWEYKRAAMDGPTPFEELKKPANAVREIMTARGIDVVDADRFQRYLADTGAAGWELVVADLDHNSWIFKRPLK
jgi:hypothetical protein